MFSKLLVLSTLSIGFFASAQVALSQDDPLCYFRKSDGTLINLSKICGKISPMPQQPKEPEFNSGSDGTQPVEPANVIDPSVTLVPGQTKEPPIVIRSTPSDLWNQAPTLPQPIQEKPVQ